MAVPQQERYLSSCIQLESEGSRSINTSKSKVDRAEHIDGRILSAATGGPLTLRASVDGDGERNLPAWTSSCGTRGCVWTESSCMVQIRLEKTAQQDSITVRFHPFRLCLVRVNMYQCVSDCAETVHLWT